MRRFDLNATWSWDRMYRAARARHLWLLWLLTCLTAFTMRPCETQCAIIVGSCVHRAARAWHTASHWPESACETIVRVSMGHHRESAYTEPRAHGIPLLIGPTALTRPLTTRPSCESQCKLHCYLIVWPTLDNLTWFAVRASCESQCDLIVWTAHGTPCAHHARSCESQCDLIVWTAHAEPFPIQPNVSHFYHQR